jgi:hypothetical protein
VNRERLEQLRRVVLAAPPERFHMRTWCEKALCGTAYCAAGWAAVDPWFRENTDIERIFRVGHDGMVYAEIFTPTDGLAKIFDISSADSRNLFGGDLNPTYSDPHGVSQKDVVANIDRILAGLPAEPYECP